MAFDGITTKAVAGELQVLAGARIDKVIQKTGMVSYRKL